MEHPEYVSVKMTIEQAAAVRAILKLELIYLLGEYIRLNEDASPLEKLTTTLSTTDNWAMLDRPFGAAMSNAVFGDAPIALDTVIDVRLSSYERRFVSNVLLKGHFRHTLDEAKTAGQGFASHFISVVLVDKNYASLQTLFAESPKSEAKEFWFDQVAPKGVIN